MGVDKSLFLYDLSVVAIMKNEGSYVKEWLDYHLLAGVDHFFIYNNGSTDNQSEVVQPYVDAGLVTYIDYPGKARQYEAYNAAVKNYKFFCRYMAFIDGDEFILPKSNSNISEVVDEVLDNNPLDGDSNAAALCVNRRYYGSNYHEKFEDYGVLERFPRCAKGFDRMFKVVTNPRKIEFFWNAHFANYFQTNFTVNEDGKKILEMFNDPPTAKKIVINHYYTKSREEYEKKIQRGLADAFHIDNSEQFSHEINNDIFDDEILKYRETCKKMLVPEGSNIVEVFSDLKQPNYERLLRALASNLLLGFDEEDTEKFFDNPRNRLEYFAKLIKFLNVESHEFFKDKVEVFLTCLNVSSFLKETFLDDELGYLFEEFSLKALCKTLSIGVSVSELQLLIRELPNILALPYSGVNAVRDACFELIPQYKDTYKIYNDLAWYKFVNLDYILSMLKVFDNYQHK